MSKENLSSGPRPMELLVLRALVRKLVERRVLSPEDVRSLLEDAAGAFDVVGGELTPEAARNLVEEDLAPLFLGR